MIFVLAGSAFGADFRVMSANYDLSNAIITLSAKDTFEGTIAENITLKKLENPTRYYFDLDSTVLTIPKQDWIFQNGNFDRVIISQFQNNPNVVRVVFYPKSDKVFKDIKFYRIKNNIIMRLNGNDIQNDYYQHIYRDEHASSSDFYENLKVVYPEPPSVNMANEIQNAFNVQPAEPPSVQKDEPDFKKFKLNTKYYLNNVTTKPNSVLLSGFGEMTFEKPMVLNNPTRLIYDFPNSLSAQEVRNREYQINETDKIVIGQFAINKVRAVIYTDNVEKYVPVLAADNQSVLFINQKTYDTSQLIQGCAQTTQYIPTEINDLTQSMTLNFDFPVVHSVDRKNNALVLTFYNVSKFNEEEFKSIFAGSFFWNAQIIKNEKSTVGVRIYLPLRQDSQVNTFLGADGKSVKVVLKETNRSKKQLFNVPTAKIPSKRIVIDAGHGGTDYGAIRGDINEKDITLDVAKKVQKELTKLGHKVIMTRSTDEYISLQDRVEITAAQKGEIFVSIHVNSSVKPEIEGIETHYYHQDSMGLAQSVHEALISNLKPFDRGLFKSKFYVINHTEIPAILCEIGFISNEEEQKLLITEKRKQETAKAIVEGVLNYFGQE